MRTSADIVAAHAFGAAPSSLTQFGPAAACITGVARGAESCENAHDVAVKAEALVYLPVRHLLTLRHGVDTLAYWRVCTCVARSCVF